MKTLDQRIAALADDLVDAAAPTQDDAALALLEDAIERGDATAAEAAIPWSAWAENTTTALSAGMAREAEHAVAKAGGDR